MTFPFLNRQRLDRKRLTSQDDEQQQEEEMETTLSTATTESNQSQLQSVVSDFVTLPKKQIRIIKKEDGEGEGEEKMEIEVAGGTGGMRSDHMAASEISVSNKSKNDLRNKIGSKQKREQLKSRLGAFPIM